MPNESAPLPGEVHADEVDCTNTLQTVFHLTDTIENLCIDNFKDGEPVASLPAPAMNSIGESPEEVSYRPSEVVMPALDVLSISFAQSISNCIAEASGLSIGLLITSKSGAIIQSVHCGWDAHGFRTQGRLLAKIAKETVWRNAPRFSTNAIRVEEQPPGSDLDPESVSSNPTEAAAKLDVETSICLNDLSEIVGTPMCAIPFPLSQSSGFAVFLCDATPCEEVGIQAYFSSAIQLWIGDANRDSLVKQLDAWLIVRRCSWFATVVGWIESVRSKPRWWLAPLAILCGTMFVPIPYYPKRDCVFEPETKQYLSSPIQGRIASCNVRPGDHVEKGQLMARLDDDQLRRDLATANAEYDAANKKRDTALATRATGNAELAIIEMNQATLRIESIQDQLQRLEIRASNTGIVVQGDWQRNIGMPLTLGQSLFEVAELESMTAEVRLLASDLAQINVGDEVSVRSDASGIESFRGKIGRIEPRATVVDDAAVFVADVVVNDPERKLRPGMKATAQINAGWRSLGWYLFHRPYQWISNQWIW